VGPAPMSKPASHLRARSADPRYGCTLVHGSAVAQSYRATFAGLLLKVWHW